MSPTYTLSEPSTHSYALSFHSLADLSARPATARDGLHFAGAILLNPARRSGARIVLCPLLPPPKPRTQLPSELWGRCLAHAMDISPQRTTLSPAEYSRLETWRRSLPLVNKMFKTLASPILYTQIEIHSLPGLESLVETLASGDRQWDSLRRIPFSTPGRWIQSLNISTLSSFTPTRSAKLRADTLLTDLFRYTPFLSTLVLDPKYVPSRRAMTSLAESCGMHLRVLKGLGIGEDSSSMPPSQWLVRRDPIVSLLRMCSGLEVLGIHGVGMVTEEDSLTVLIAQLGLTFEPISLPRLHTLTLHGVPQAPVFHCLAISPLPALVRLTITSYPSKLKPSPTAAFLASHNRTIQSLILASPPDWPPPDHLVSVNVFPASTHKESILHLLPNLLRLNICLPLPSSLALEPLPSSPLRTFILPRPVSSVFPFVQEMSTKSEHFATVLWSRSRWLRLDLGATSRVARMAGEQAEMWRWRRVINTRIRVVDCDGREG